MDSFFSLFDPSDGAAKTNKNKGDTPKGRRRGRKCSGKNETLPEESSFLCEPDLSTELLVKDGSYIDSYIEVNTHDKSDTTQDLNKPKRRNSGRKTRRRKSKVSPAKDSLFDAWTETESETVTEPVTVTESVTVTKTGSTNWNNRWSKPKNNGGNIGKNVNDLKKESDSEFKKCKRKNSCDSTTLTDGRRNSYDLTATSDVVKRKNSSENSDVGRKAINNVIDKLEKVGLKDDMYLAGDFNTEDLENDEFYSSEDLDESYDDSASETDGSVEESYGSLPPEPRFGNVEYKLQLVNVCERRFQHLVTQLKWRLRSGGGSAVYVLGVSDCGALRGLRARALRGSLGTLRAMAASIGATLAHVTARRVQPHRAVAEVILRKLPHSQQSELRIAVMGADEAGKSTLIGVLTQGELDNGRGSARLNMFRHLHEVRSGRTSSLSHEILGFDSQGNVVNYGCSELMTAERIGERSAKLVSFLDLAGHSKYQRTTLHGLTGYCPHYAMLVISATAGITPITSEHIGVLLALDLPFFCVITKCELAPQASQPLTARLQQLLAPAGKKPLLITDENLARTCVAPQPLILDTIDIDGNGNGNGNRADDPVDTAYGSAATGGGIVGEAKATLDESVPPVVPVFPISCVTGMGLSALHAYLLALQPITADSLPEYDDEPCEFQIDEVFHVGESSGPVVGGLLASGTLREGDNLILGPLESGEFVRTSVRSIYRNRVPHHSVGRGRCASLGLIDRHIQIRPGMVLLSIPPHYQSSDYERPSFGGCAPGACNRKTQLPPIQLPQHKADNSKNSKNIRRKNKNIIQDIAKVERSLVKIDHIEDSNLYQSDNEKNDKKIMKKDIYNEVPDITDLEKDLTLKTNVIDVQTKAKDLKTNIKDTKNNTVNLKTETIDKTDVNGNANQMIEAIGENTEANGETSCENGETSGENGETSGENANEECKCKDAVLLEDPNDPRGCMYFQATIHVLRHSTAICPGFQCTVHVGNVRQTAIIEAILSWSGSVRCGQSASCLFRWARCPEYLVTGRRLLLTAGLPTRAIGRITQIFPYVP